MQFDKNYFESKWHQLKGNVKQKWGKLTDNDIHQIEGVEEKMIGKLQEYYNLSYEEARKELDNFKNEHYKEVQNA
jgi:uncharacterized protein YjbJ (UPF0337 family)